MKTNYIPKIKICCISTIKEAKLAIRYGASTVGLVSEMPSGPGVINEKNILEIAKNIPPGISSFLLTSKQSVEEIIQQQRQCKTNTIQLCDSLDSKQHQELRKKLPGISIVQVIHVCSEESLEEAINASINCHGLLLDSGNQKLKVKELGGTGRIHNWSISKKIVNAVNVPVYLAGGLNAENVKDAIKTVRPFGVDICSGVRTNGKLDKTKLIRYIFNVEHWFE
jgi:phosphoribosylanthranilate isomerase